MRWQIFGLSVWVAAEAAGAAPRQLTGQELTEKVPGAQIAIDTPIGSKIPMRFGRDGLVTGEAGVLGVYLGAAKDRGRWWVENHRLCIKWFRWFDAVPRCLDLKLDGNRILWRKDDGESGTGTLTERPSIAAAPSPPVKTTAAPEPPSATVERQVAPAPLTLQSPASTPAAAVPDIAVAPPPAETRPAAPSADSIAVEAPKTVVEAPPDPAPKVRPAAVPVAESKPIAPKKTAARAAAASAAVAPRTETALRSQPKPETGGPSFRVARVDDNDMLNIRSGPSDRRPVIGIIPPRGRGVRIVGLCRGDWCPIRHGGVSGWVNRYYLAEDAPRTPVRN